MKIVKFVIVMLLIGIMLVLFIATTATALGGAYFLTMAATTDLLSEKSRLFMNGWSCLPIAALLGTMLKGVFGLADNIMDSIT